ncbi:MAG: hypothetical protein A2X94_05015 [Bdellovibrionales bacterium GWB1_55_8]|nr:MAG: hypothetical protein A2X94_05015 [Bdellovibrionales bacterium GWB1_55_8]
MLTYTIRRLGSAIPLLFLLAAMTFFLLRLAPGGPFDGDRAWPPEVKANIERQYGLDLPIHIQFGKWVYGAVQGDLKTSFQFVDRPVTEIIAGTLPVSIYLGTAALLFSILVGVPLGAAAAARQNTWIDNVAMFIATSGISIPSYLVASLLVIVFALWLPWFPPALWEEPSSVVLPALTLAWRPMAMIARLTRASMLETFRADFVRTAHSKGVPEAQVIFKHVLKNSLIPIITLMGPIVANLLTGSFLVEFVFEIPGMGKHFVHAVLNRDYPLVMGVTLVYAVILVASNMFVDLVYAWVDPRIRLER